MARRLREEQDADYERSLQADREREARKREEVERARREEREREEEEARVRYVLPTCHHATCSLLINTSMTDLHIYIFLSIHILIGLRRRL